MVENSQGKIILYGTSWCGSTRRARTLLDEEKIEYVWVDIEKDDEAAKYVESVANGFRSVPTLRFPDGTVLVEPSMFELRSKLGL